MDYSIDDIISACEGIIGKEILQGFLATGTPWPTILKVVALEAFMHDGKYWLRDIAVIRNVMIHIYDGGYLPEGL